MLVGYKTIFLKQNCDENEDVFPFQKTEDYAHPSCINDVMRQGHVVREGPNFALQAPQRLFADAGMFHGNIFDDSCPVTKSTDECALHVLLLFYPYRSVTDLLPNNGSASFTEKLREVNKVNGLHPFHSTFLQNMQDSAHNFCRHQLNDPLEKRTDCPNWREGNSDEPNNENKNIEDEDLAHRLMISDAIFEEEAEPSLVNEHQGISEVSFKRIVNSAGESSNLDCKDVSDNVALFDAEPGRVQGEFYENLEYQDDAPDIEPNIEESPILRNPNRGTVHSLYARDCTHMTKLPTRSEPANVVECNGTAMSVVDWGTKSNLDLRQMKAFTIIMSKFLLTFHDTFPENDENISDLAKEELKKKRQELEELCAMGNVNDRGKNQLIVILHGPGGSGKSAVIELVCACAKKYCQNLNCHFDDNTIVVAAMSGVAATQLNGQTAHSKIGIGGNSKISGEQIEEWRNARLLTIDEMSFLDKEEMENTDKRLRRFMEEMDKRLGGLNVLLAGDFRQLKPAGKEPLCEKPCTIATEWVNMFVELDGNHRFREDPEWGRLLRKLRDGTTTVAEIDCINEKCRADRVDQLPAGIQCASYCNKTRDAINAMAFKKFTQKNRRSDDTASDCMLIFADEVMRKNSDKMFVPLSDRQTLCEKVGEDDVKPAKMKSRVDPALKLFRDCPMMLTHNEDVKAGLANGTCATLERAVLKQNVVPFQATVENAINVESVYASQVDRSLLRNSMGLNEGEVFAVKPTTHHVNVNWPLPDDLQSDRGKKERTPMKMKQLPAVRNTCTAGHKLQGKSLENIFIVNWNYSTNWPCVVLSRVRKMSGVYMRKLLSRDLNFCKVPPSLTAFLNSLKLNEPNYPELEQCSQRFL